MLLALPGAILISCKTKDAAATGSATVTPAASGAATAPPTGSVVPGAVSSLAPGAAGSPPVGSKQTTYSGLQYEVLRAGTGARPTAFNRVKVHYHGTLLNGTVFDSSVQRGQPAEFGLNQVIPGWREGIPLMQEGAKYRFTVPPQLAYGAKGAPPKIGPNETLIFEVDLLQILY
jgi:hypothetical protein